MRTIVIAKHIDNENKITGFRMYNIDNREIEDISLEEFISKLNTKEITIENIKYNSSLKQIKEKLVRYPRIIKTDKESLAQHEVSYYKSEIKRITNILDALKDSNELINNKDIDNDTRRRILKKCEKGYHYGFMGREDELKSMIKGLTMLLEEDERIKSEYPKIEIEYPNRVYIINKTDNYTEVVNYEGKEKRLSNEQLLQEIETGEIELLNKVIKGYELKLNIHKFIVEHTIVGVKHKIIPIEETYYMSREYVLDYVRHVYNLDLEIKLVENLKLIEYNEERERRDRGVIDWNLMGISNKLLEDKKYITLDSDTIEYKDDNGKTTTLHRIIALKEIYSHKPKIVKLAQRGSLGGYIESERNLSHNGECWVRGKSKILGNALVKENAQLFGNVTVKDEAVVKGDSEILHDAIISGNAVVSGTSTIRDNARVHEDAAINNGHVIEHGNVHGRAKVYGYIKDYGEVYGNSVIDGFSHVCGFAVVRGDSLIEAGIIQDFATVTSVRVFGVTVKRFACAVDKKIINYNVYVTKGEESILRAERMRDSMDKEKRELAKEILSR